MSVESDTPQPAELLSERARIRQLDAALVEILAQRVATARRLGALKRDAGLLRLDPAREAEVIRQGVELARAANLDEEAVREIFWQVVGLCRRAQAGEE